MASNGQVDYIDNTSTSVKPIVIAGGGCVGLFLALLLCQSDIPNKVIVSWSLHSSRLIVS
jgi:hypothetical protein